MGRTGTVVVVGAGVVGASVAFHLAEAGVDVVVLERDEPASGSSGKPVGGVRAQFSDPLNVALGHRSLAAYAGFARRPGAEIGLHRVGYLFLLPRQADVDLFGDSVAVQRSLGVPSRMVELDEAVRLNPWVDVSAYEGAAYSPDDGWARPGAVVHGYLDAARALGARVLTRTPVLGIERAGGRVTGVRTPTGTLATGTVVCCAGAWSQALGAMVDVSLPVVPLRRQVALTGRPPPRPGGRSPLPFTIDYGSTFYVHDTGDGPDAGLLLGIADPATAPGFDRGYDDAWLPVLRAAARRCTPGLAEVPVTSGWAGLYETTPDNDALVGEADGVGRFLYATGFSGHGFLQAPAVGEVVRDLVLGVAPPIDVAPLHADRFAGARPVRAEAAII